ncbi:6-phosphogluconolactonase [Virgisporangium aliadipatigenens]|uniref:6-phosphogluconolactonase n=1 Tax=Virgisporangium aliadipatigenens TaxID=741659 RepID=A0A8J3YL53_9ACTN|nr:6-phosphogluconolactonase [Virgisporangium aliadipatigenens]GIJ47419.1 6-phosphogluconolactonase [Virgisporangium aliadipatigenens]
MRVIYESAELLAATAAARLAVTLADAQAVRGTASVVLTGGGIAAKLYSALRDAPYRDAVDWSRVDFWWGDERFLPTGDPERNETQARAALLDALPVPPENIHAMPATDGPDGGDPDAAAARYAAALAGPFDVVLLGVGEDGHVASLFPGHPEVDITDLTVSAVRDSPKPPPTRITLTLPVLTSAREVWLVAAGAGKAEAVASALSDGPVPAARVRGAERTLWLLDAAAASRL